jgi:hypothetical protein
MSGYGKSKQSSDSSENSSLIKLSKKVIKLEAELLKLNVSNADLMEQVKSQGLVMDKQQSEIKKLRVEMRQLCKDFGVLKAELEDSCTSLVKAQVELKGELNSMTDKLNKSEVVVKKNSVVIHGLELEQMSNKDRVVEWLEKMLQVKFEIKSTAQIGKQKTSVLVEFKDRCDKSLLFKNCHKLKGQKISVQDFLSNEERRRLHQLLLEAASLRKQGVKAFVKNLKLVVPIPCKDAVSIVTPSKDLVCSYEANQVEKVKKLDDVKQNQEPTHMKCKLELIDSDLVLMDLWHSDVASYLFEAESWERPSLVHQLLVKNFLKMKCSICLATREDDAWRDFCRVVSGQFWARVKKYRIDRLEAGKLSNSYGNRY